MNDELRFFRTFAPKYVCNMEKQQSDILMKVRSYRSVLKTGIQLYASHFRRLFKASWIMAMLFALTCGAFSTLAVIRIPALTTALLRQQMQQQAFLSDTVMQYLTTLGLFLLLLLASIVTLTLAEATILAKLKEHKETGAIAIPHSWFKVSPTMMGRSLKGMLCMLVVVLVPYLLVVAVLLALRQVDAQLFGAHHGVLTVFMIITFLVLLVLLIPLCYVLMKYLMEAPLGFWKALHRHYSQGMRHWGHLFLVLFCCVLFIQLVSFIVMMPAFILCAANQTAQYGQLLGDPLGMPTYITLLTYATLSFCAFLQFYVSMPLLVSIYYSYGSIASSER